MNIRYVELRGEEIKPYMQEIARLRITVFAEWPYIYKGSLDYELKYLETYAKSEKSFIVVALDGEKAIGATTAIWLPDADPEFQKPFLDRHYDLKAVCYYGESVTLPAYRGFGLGKKFMAAREVFARSLGVHFACFCAVVRPAEHPLRPSHYRQLDEFWQKAGFSKVPGMVAKYTWQDVGDSHETEKELVFWCKNLK